MVLEYQRWWYIETKNTNIISMSYSVWNEQKKKNANDPVHILYTSTYHRTRDWTQWIYFYIVFWPNRPIALYYYKLSLCIIIYIHRICAHENQTRASGRHDKIYREPPPPCPAISFLFLPLFCSRGGRERRAAAGVKNSLNFFFPLPSLDSPRFRTHLYYIYTHTHTHTREVWVGTTINTNIVVGRYLPI